MKSKKKMNKRKLIAFIAGASAVAILAVGSTVAYFTDRVNKSNSVDAGDVTIALSDLDVDTNDIIAPGSIIPVGYTVSNTGSLAADIKETITLSIFKADGTTPINIGSNSEFDIYKRDDVTLEAGKGWVPKESATPVAATSDSNKRIITVPQYTLNGTDETISGVSSDKSTSPYVILFKRTASNAFRNCKIKIDNVVEAKQHTYTSDYDSDWTELQSKSVELSTGGTQAAVPAKDEF